ncbi:EamA family transporter [Iamia sp. SCSIO 61187]|uniref:DMT family transporter n=1 Tax=Iamia sp. SCSIO 61187 TaxID=2722752 RepID=UPI001C628C95|nr:DMT family transporter [Iamia sp. SCSIO 61187]QYG92575.1 EamA family transporter [Iamia sp. SCSIO 61187]
MLAATLLALGSALVHASWNLLIKTSDDRALAAWGQFSAAAALALVGLVVVGFPGWAALPYLAGTAAVHIVYLESLVAAYTHGDFSLSYPLARGGGAVLAALGSTLVLDDRLPALGWLAIAVAAAGLVGLRGRGVPVADDVVLGDAADVSARAGRAGERAALGFALLTAACIATYTIVDSAGSRAGESGVAYGLASVAASGVAISVANVLRPSRRARAALLRRDWRRHLAGGVGTLVAYTMVLVAVRRAPVGYVTMLRESSVVIGALVGWLVLGEGLGRRRLAASGVILAGLVLLVAAGG